MCAVFVVSIHRSRVTQSADFASRVRSWAKLNWICYAPTGYDPRRSAFPTEASIASDLELLKASGFDGIITYESNQPFFRIAGIARQMGLMVIQGVWAPADRKELARAVELQDQVVAYCVGNEGLGTRYSLRELDQGATFLANRVRVPVTISEQIHVYYQHPELTDLGDWLFPIVHPHFANARSPEAATGWINANTGRLLQTARDRKQTKPLFVKEIGMPSAGDPMYSENEQARFLESLMLTTKLQFALFEAFDRKGWEYVSSVEPHWGLFRYDRSGKPISRRFPGLLRARGENTQKQGL